MFRLEKRRLKGHITVYKHVKRHCKEDWDQFTLVSEDGMGSNGF